MSRLGSRIPLLVTLSLLIVLIVPRLALAQPLPLSGVLDLAKPIPSPFPNATYYYWGADAVDLGSSGFATAWAVGIRIGDPGDRDRINPFTAGLALDRDGHRLREFDPSTQLDPEYGVEAPLLARLGRGPNPRFVAAFQQWRFAGTDLWFRRFQADGQPIDPESVRLGDGAEGRWDTGPAIASDDAGRFVLAWTRGPSGDELQVASLHFQVFEANGEPLTPEIEAARGEVAKMALARAVGIDGEGHVTLAWSTPDGLQLGRFRLSGEALVPPTRIGDSVADLALAQEPGGGFVLATLDGSTGPNLVRSIRLRAFRADGTRTGAAVEVQRSAGISRPNLARDRFGNLALFWLEGGRPALALFSRVPSEPVVLVRQGPVVLGAPFTNSQGSPGGSGLALSDDGRLLTTWLARRGNRVRDSVVGRLWQARKEADLCLVRGFHLLCDLGNDGGTAEYRLPFGPAGVPRVLGDLDGDGRDDLCYFQDRRFHCDTAHDGGAPERQSVQLPDVPPAGSQLFLVDFDGEEGGEAEPCIRTGRAWACMAWNPFAGWHRVGWTFGTGDDPGVLGDVDGDGKPEACLYRNARFRCDTGHDGGTAERTFDLSSLLAGLPAGTPLLGDVDGDGRADPCVYTEGRLLCGLLPGNASRPSRTLEIAFGRPDDVPLLGNLDGF